MSAYPDCQSTRGQWGQVCPDCGQVLPKRQPPLQSWKAERAMERATPAGGRTPYTSQYEPG